MELLPDGPPVDVVGESMVCPVCEEELLEVEGVVCFVLDLLHDVIPNAVKLRMRVRYFVLIGKNS